MSRVCMYLSYGRTYGGSIDVPSEAASVASMLYLLVLVICNVMDLWYSVTIR